MNKNIERLTLGETYDFSVIANLGGASVSGKLHLTPSKLTLELAGDTSKDRRVDASWDDRGHLRCTTNSGKHILLIGLTLTFALSKKVEIYPQSIGGFELQYDVQNVVFSRTPITPDDTFTQLEIQAPAIDKWVGSTSTQYAIVDAYHDGSLFKTAVPVEAQQAIANLGLLRVDYAVETHHSENFEAGVRFPPRIILYFSEEKNVHQIIEIFEQTTNLLSTIIGVPILCTSVKLKARGNNVFDASTFFTKQPVPKSVLEWPMFALGHNLRHNQFALPAFPLHSFDAFFNSSSALKNAFSKYIKYRSFINPEERFLGYFRILEKLTADRDSYVDQARLGKLLERSETFLSKFFGDRKAARALSKQILRANESKLNTASCIRRFVKLVPADVTQNWLYGNVEIDQICKLRNDLTHANEVEPNEMILHKYVKFIEVLLVLALFNKIGIPPASMASSIKRLAGYDWIVKPPEIKYVTYPIS